MSDAFSKPAGPRATVARGKETGVVGRRLERGFFGRDSREVAPELLGKLLVSGRCSGRIVEVEAYCGEEDPASHAYRGMTPRNATMFGRAGFLYVYFSYGVHWCANIVCGQEGVASAVLLRSLAPVAGVEEMRSRRATARRDRDLCNGPGKLCQALAITGRQDGADLVEARNGIWIEDDGEAPPATPGVGPRIGISSARSEPWRWWVPGDQHVSAGGARAATGARGRQ